MVEAFESNTHCARARSDSHEAHAFHDSFAWFGDDRKSNSDVRSLSGRGRRTRPACGNRPLGKNTVNVFGHPPSDLFYGTDSGNDFAPKQCQLFYGDGRIRQFGSRSGLGFKKLGRLRAIVSRFVR